MKKKWEWIKSNKVIAFLFAFSFFVLSPAIKSAIYLKRDSNWWNVFLNMFPHNAFGSWVLFLTCIAIVWYTLETAELRRVTQWSAELSNRPLLFVEIKKVFERENAHGFILNTGKGCAVNVFLEILVDDNFEHTENIDFIDTGKKERISEHFETSLYGFREGTLGLKMTYFDITKQKKYFSNYKILDGVVKLENYGIM